MPYKLHAEIVDPTTRTRESGTGTVDVTATTLKDAVEKATDLRKQGFTVRVTDHDGNIIPKEVIDAHRT